jgi:pimeloyl-ACP methyl ester carboxylesterase
MSKITSDAAARCVSSPLVIALHCSGGTGHQWQKLRQALGPPFNVISPNLIGCGDNPHWSGKSRFKLTDEARSIVESIDAWNGAVHLVGHSYGGAVALRVAVERLARIASLSLYEPTAFHVLKATGEDGQHARKPSDARLRGKARTASTSTCVMRTTTSCAQQKPRHPTPMTGEELPSQSRTALVRS